MVRTVAAKARKAIVKAVQRSAHGIRTVAGDAAGAAAQAAAGVVLELDRQRARGGPDGSHTIGAGREKKAGAGGQAHDRRTQPRVERTQAFRKGDPRPHRQKDGSKKNRAETQGQTPLAVANHAQLPPACSARD